MKEEKKQVEVETSTTPVTPAFPDQKFSVPVVPKTSKPTSMEGAIRAGISAGRKFKLVRKVFQGKNGKFYYSYSIIVMMNNATLCREIRLLPDLGYVGKDSFRSMQSNSAGFGYLNLLYDSGNGADLICKEEPVVDRYGNFSDYTVFNFYAQTVDDSGVIQEYLMKPNTSGDKSMLLGAFSGFGGIRDWTQDDLNQCGKLQELFAGYCAPGYAPQVQVDNQ